MASDHAWLGGEDGSDAADSLVLPVFQLCTQKLNTFALRADGPAGGGKGKPRYDHCCKNIAVND